MAAVVGFPSMTSRREGIQPHIPKLTYRNCPSSTSIGGSSIVTVGTHSSTASISTAATSPSVSSFRGSPRSFQSPGSSLGPFSFDGASDRPATSAYLSPRSAKDPKKKSSSFFNFLSVKEPSTQAFEVYQEQMKKRGTTQSGRANAVGLPGVSSAKLPPTVPKVNSKWDGVPQIKEKSNEKSMSEQSAFNLSASRPLYTSQSTGSNMTTSTLSSTSSTRSAPRSNGKLKFDDSNGSLSDIYGWETRTPSSSSSTRSLQLESRGSAISAPSLRNVGSLSTDVPLPTAIPKAGHSTNVSQGFESSTDRFPSVVPSASPPPLTRESPLQSLPVPPLCNSSSHNASMKEPSVADKGVILTSSGTNVLGPPVSATRKAPPTTYPFAKSVDVEPPSDIPGTILKRPALTHTDSWPLQSTPLKEAPEAHENRVTHSPAASNGTKSKRSRMRAMFGKGS
ncbi:MAG: hypothetical protein L6R41_003292 [Letrouitia leprolyta]|nr:MAG: hypothetical protein L6R41_003292 [Letrouitia leprolyta]